MKKDVLNPVYRHYEYVCSHYDEDRILGVFLYGSQNYALDNGDSDVDTKAIYIPTFKEVVFNKPISKELVLPSTGEHCEVKDIREFIRNLKKQNINFVETLFTPYFIINPKYKAIWEELISKKELLARYDVAAGIKSMSCQALHTLKQITEDLPHEKASKKLSNATRLIYFLERYIRGEEYSKCIIPEGDSYDLIYSMKMGKYQSSPFTIDVLKMILNNYIEGDYSYLVDVERKEALDEFLEYIILKSIKLNF